MVRGRSGNGRTVKLHSTGLVAARSTPVRVGTGTPAERRVRVPAGTDVARFATAAGASAATCGCSAAATSSAARPRRPRGHARPTRVPATTASWSARPATSRPTATRLLTWVVPQRGGSAVDLSTDAVGFASGRKFRYSASWDDLDPSKQYLGVVGYGDSDRRTLLEVDP